LDRKRSEFVFGSRQLIVQRLFFALQNRKLLFQLRKRAFQLGFLDLKADSDGQSHAQANLRGVASVLGACA